VKRVLEMGPVVNEARPSLPGDVRGLTARLGSPDAQVRHPVLAGLAQANVVDLPSLRMFLDRYQCEVLGPVELPLIQRAAQHAHRHEVRELLALDCALTQDPRLTRFAAASQAVGRAQLWRLRPLRDLRLVRRYWAAVEARRAMAWHPLVYGVILAVFSIPLRQGLLHYGGQTLGGFLDAAATALRLGVVDRAALAAEIDRALPVLVQRSLLPPAPPCAHVCPLPLPRS